LILPLESNRLGSRYGVWPVSAYQVNTLSRCDETTEIPRAILGFSDSSGAGLRAFKG
jgi:hypothetical protein